MRADSFIIVRTFVCFCVLLLCLFTLSPKIMRRVNPFRGLGIALVTPFTEDGAVDYAQIERLVEFQISAGVDFICVLGTTAETPCLTCDEKRQIVEVVKRVNDGRLPLLLGAGGNCTAQVVDFLSNEPLDGIDGVLIVAPYYNKPTQEGLYRHFKAVAEASPLPVVLYNVPGRTGVNISAQTTLRIARECANVVAIKEASGIISQIDEIIEGAPDGFEILSGDDAITFELLTIGAVGVISVVGNAYPSEFGSMVHHALSGDFNSALQMHRRLSKAYGLLSVDGNPAGIKALLSIKKMSQNVLRLPIVPVRQDIYEKMERFVENFHPEKA